MSSGTYFPTPIRSLNAPRSKAICAASTSTSTTFWSTESRSRGR
jgi:hypothetical protein